MVIFFILIFSLLLSPFLPNQFITVNGSTPFFTLNLLCPNTETDRIEWTNLISTELPSIGINPAVDITDWGSVISRTLGYPLITYDYIPSYEKGGFDLFSVGSYFHYMDVLLGKNYNSESIYPDGRNYIQYNSSTFDSLFNQYIVTTDPIERVNLIYELQDVLFEDLPTIPILYNENFFVVKDGLQGIDYLLLSLAENRIENWDDPTDHILNYSVPYPFDYYNNFKAYHAPAITTHNLWMQPVYGTLMKYETDTHEYVNDIASNVVIDVGSTDMNITVTLNFNAKFSDGNPVLPSDIIYSYMLLMSPEVLSPSYEDLTEIFDTNSSISVVGSDVAGGQIKFELNKRTTYPERLLNYPIIDKSEVEAKIASYDYTIFDEYPGGTNVEYSLVKSCGPMILNSFDPINNIAKLTPNPYWHGSTFNLTQFNIEYEPDTNTALSKLLAGSFDIIDREYKLVPSEISGLSGIHSEISDSLVYQHFGVNMKHPIIGTGELSPLGTAESAKNIRKAISYIVPKQIIISTILDSLGIPARSPIPPGCYGYNESLVFHQYDVSVARSYMELAGYSYVVVSEFDRLSTLIVIIGIISLGYSLFVQKRKINVDYDK